jgi:hypothetical protein
MLEQTLTTTSKKPSVLRLCPVLLFGLLVVLVLYVFLVAPVTVTLDGYSHLYGGEALRSMLGGQPEVHSNFSYNSILLPNWLCALFLAALSTIVSSDLALKLLIVLIGIALISSLYFCIDATLYHRHQRAQVLVVLLPFALNGYLTLGFYGFLISSSMCIFILGLHLRHSLRMPVRLQCLTACLLLLAYLSNPVPVIISFLFPCASFISDAIIHWHDGWRRSAAALKHHAFDTWPWLAPACMLPWFYLRLSKAAAAGLPAESITFKLTHRIVELARDAVLYISPTENVGTLFIALLSIILAGVFLSRRKLFMQNRLRFTNLTVLIFSTMILYLIVPDYAGDGAHIANRFLFHSALFLVLLALTSGVLDAQLLTLCSLLAALSVVGFAGEYLLLSKRLAPAVAEVRAAMEIVPRHSRILIMGYRMTPSPCEGWPLLKRTIPERHWALLGALKNELIVLNDYEANTSHFPLEYLTRRYRGVINEVNLGADLSAEQNRAAWLETLNSDSDVDFVVSWGVPRGVDCMRSVYSPFGEALKSRYDVVVSVQGTSHVELWRKRR